MFGRCFVSIFSICVATFAQQNVSAAGSWKQHMDLGKKLEARGHYTGANDEYEAALRVVSKLSRDGRAFLSRIALGNVAAATGRYTDAEQWDNEAVREGLEIYGNDAPELAVPFGSLAALYRDQGNYARAEEFSRRAVSLMSDEQRAVPAQRAQLLGMLGGILSARGKFGDAEAALQQAYGHQKDLQHGVELGHVQWPYGDALS